VGEEFNSSCKVEEEEQLEIWPVLERTEIGTTCCFDVMFVLEFKLFVCSKIS
jgi:hypothetical protein